MGLPKSILYPVDFSPRCLETWPAVAAVASALDAHVTMLHAFDAGRWELDLADLQGELATIHDRLAKKLATWPVGEPGIPHLVREMAEGHPVDCILKRAAEMQDPLIMLPTRGQTRFRSLLLGSVTAGILHDAAWPVWTDAHREGQGEHRAHYRSIVCAIDMGHKTPRLLRAASEYAAAFGAKLHVVHAVPGVDPTFPSATADRSHEFLVSEAKDKYPAFCKTAGVDLPLEIAEEVGLTDGIVSATGRLAADLLIIGRGSMQGFLGRLRTNAHELVRRSPCPVLSL